MMISDLVDQQDFLEGLCQKVQTLHWHNEEDLLGALTAAADTATDDEWSNLAQWINELVHNWTLLLPEIQHALQQNWHSQRPLPETVRIPSVL